MILRHRSVRCDTIFANAWQACTSSCMDGFFYTTLKQIFAQCRFQVP